MKLMSFILVLLLFLISSSFTPALKACGKELSNQNNPKQENASKKIEALKDALDKYDNINYSKILNQEYSCYYNNCYNLETFRYDKKTNTYFVDMMVDLLNRNEHQLYKSPHNDGDITHIIFKTEFHDGKITVKYKGYASGYLEPIYKYDGVYIINYEISAIHKDVPKMIKDYMQKNGGSFMDWIDSYHYIENIKTLADIF